MRLEVDLAFDSVPRTAGESDGEAAAPAIEGIDLHALSAALRRPKRLWRLLRKRHYAELAVREGPLPLSAVQAVALASLAIARTDAFTVEDSHMRRGGFMVHALARLMVAAPRELIHTALLAQRARQAAERTYSLPAGVTRPRTALYMRVDPTLRWLGKQVGGAATHTTGVINGLLDNDVAVQVLAAERPQGTERAAFVPVAPRRILQLVRGLTYTDYSIALLNAARAARADFVYQRYQLGAYAGLELARRLDVPLVLEFNGSEIWVERHWGSGHIRLQPTLERLELCNVRAASLVVVVSEALKDIVVELGVATDRVLVNPNGVDVAALAPLRDRSPAQRRGELNLPEAPTIGFIGTFGPWHGVSVLPALIEAVPRTRWILVGDGGLLPRVRAEIAAREVADRTLITGIVDHGRALELLACCDVCVSPHIPNPDGTPFFGSPTKLFEYMGLSKPIVASDLDQIGEVIENERSGLLVPPGDVAAAAAAISRVLDDPALARRLGDGALARADAEYSWASHVRRILDALDAGCL